MGFSSLLARVWRELRRGKLSLHQKTCPPVPLRKRVSWLENPIYAGAGNGETCPDQLAAGSHLLCHLGVLPSGKLGLRPANKRSIVLCE